MNLCGGIAVNVVVVHRYHLKSQKFKSYYSISEKRKKYTPLLFVVLNYSDLSRPSQMYACRHAYTRSRKSMNEYSTFTFLAIRSWW